MNDGTNLEYYSPEKPEQTLSTYDFVRASVKEFHQTTGQFIGNESDFEVPPLSVQEMRQNLIDEERIELLKEICDLAYVLVGSDIEWAVRATERVVAELELICVVLGMDFREAFKRVHDNNLGRIIQPDGSIKRREDGKILKSVEYPKVDLSDLV